MQCGQIYLCHLVVREGAWFDPGDGVLRVQGSLLHFLCMWQHEAARRDAGVVGEAVPNNRINHYPCGLASTNWRRVGYQGVGGMRQRWLLRPSAS